ncbi:hypothetical protein V8E36_005108 [Tilletia maclaganii]
MADNTQFNIPDCSTHQAHDMVDKTALQSAGKRPANGRPSQHKPPPPNKQGIGDIVAENSSISIQVHDRLDPTVVRARTAVSAIRAMEQELSSAKVTISRLDSNSDLAKKAAEDALAQHNAALAAKATELAGPKLLLTIKDAEVNAALAAVTKEAAEQNAPCAY